MLHANRLAVLDGGQIFKGSTSLTCVVGKEVNPLDTIR